MAKLIYPSVIKKDLKFTALADLGLQMKKQPTALIMTNFVELVPAEFLVLLAEKWSVTGYDGWLLIENEAKQRALIKDAVHLHRYKGTVWSIREVIRKLGFGEVEIIEGVMTHRDAVDRYDGKVTANGDTLFSEDLRYYFNGQIRYNGENSYDNAGSIYHWSHYRVVLNKIITRQQANLLREVLQFYAPARCILDGFEYTEVALRYNGIANCDGEYYFGMID